MTAKLAWRGRMSVHFRSSDLAGAVTSTEAYDKVNPDKALVRDERRLFFDFATDLLQSLLNIYKSNTA
jgi:hypothetical protein